MQGNVRTKIYSSLSSEEQEQRKRRLKNIARQIYPNIMNEILQHVEDNTIVWKHDHNDTQRLNKEDVLKFQMDTKQMVDSRLEGITSDGIQDSNVERKMGPIAVMFDYYGVFLPMPLDLSQRIEQSSSLSDFQKSLYLNIPINGDTHEQEVTQNLLSLLLSFQFGQLEKRLISNNFIGIFLKLIKGDYQSCLDNIQKIKEKVSNDYILIYLESLCHFLLGDYSSALFLSEESIDLMMDYNHDEPYQYKSTLDNICTPLRIQPLILYCWILTKLFEYSYAEKLFSVCTEDLFPMNAEAHFNHAQFLTYIHGCYNSTPQNEEVVSKIDFHLKTCVELMIGKEALNGDKNKVIQHNPTIQSRYYSLFKYWNHYLHFLSLTNKNRMHHVMMLGEQFAMTSLKSIGIELTNGSLTSEGNKTTTLPCHPIELAFLLVACARQYATTPEFIPRADHLYRVASELELICYKDFNTKHHNLLFYCKRLGCCEMFSISKEYRSFSEHVNKK